MTCWRVKSFRTSVLKVCIIHICVFHTCIELEWRVQVHAKCPPWDIGGLQFHRKKATHFEPGKKEERTLGFPVCISIFQHSLDDRDSCGWCWKWHVLPSLIGLRKWGPQVDGKCRSPPCLKSLKYTQDIWDIVIRARLTLYFAKLSKDCDGFRAKPTGN